MRKRHGITTAEQLQALSPMPDDRTLDEHPELYDRYEEMLKALKEEMTPSLIAAALKTFGYGQANEMYWSMVHLLEAQPRDQLHKALRTSLATGAAGERLWAAEMLGRFADPADVEVLVKKLDDPKDLVRGSVVSALGRIGDARAVPALEKMAADPSPEVQSYLVDALTRLHAKRRGSRSGRNE